MLKTIEESKNYQAKVFEITEYTKHPNADKLFCVVVDFQRVITGVEPKIGDKYVYFPVLSKINKDFLREINGYRESNLNKDTTVKSFFESHGRVKPIKLRGLSSEGYIHPAKDIEEFLKTSLKVGDEFNECNGVILCDKYVIQEKIKREHNKVGKSPKQSRLIDNQFTLSVDVDNIRRNMNKIELSDWISITYKIHGANFSAGNVLVKKKLNWKDRLAKRLGIAVEDKEYDVVIGSRRVIKNKFQDEVKQGYYKEDIWTKKGEEVKDKIPKGFTIYGELVNQSSLGEWIQKDYKYGYGEKETGLIVFRVTFTNPDGLSYNLSPLQIREFCEKYGFNHKNIFFFYGTVAQFCEANNIDTSTHWQENFIKKLEELYTEKDCFMNTHMKLPEEGVCIYKDSLFNTEVFKLKSFRFLDKENSELDKGITNMEDNG